MYIAVSPEPSNSEVDAFVDHITCILIVAYLIFLIKMHIRSSTTITSIDFSYLLIWLLLLYNTIIS